MMTRFDRRPCHGRHSAWNAGCRFLLGWLIAGHAWCAETARDIFGRDQNTLLAAKTTVRGGFVFCTGKAVFNPAAGTGIGLAKAKQFACGNLAEYFYGRIAWPESVAMELRPAIWHEYLKAAPFSIEARQGETVYSKAEAKDKYAVVVAFPETKLNAVLPLFEQIKSVVSHKTHYTNPAADVTVALELAGDDEPVLAAFASAQEKKYGANAAAVIHDTNAETFMLVPEMPQDMSAVKLGGLFALLQAMPYHPQVCHALGGYYGRMGRKKTALIFYTRGLRAPLLSPVFAQQCADAVNGNPGSPAWPSDIRAAFTAYCAEARFEQDSLRFLTLAAGGIPLGSTEPARDDAYAAGKQAFQENRLQDAYHAFVQSSAQRISFDACNMAGNAGRRTGRYNESIALLLQAAVADPSQSYPWINLAWIFHELNNALLLDFCLAQTRRFDLDDWGRQQLQQLSTP